MSDLTKNSQYNDISEFLKKKIDELEQIHQNNLGIQLESLYTSEAKSKLAQYLQQKEYNDLSRTYSKVLFPIYTQSITDEPLVSVRLLKPITIDFTTIKVGDYWMMYDMGDCWVMPVKGMNYQVPSEYAELDMSLDIKMEMIKDVAYSIISQEQIDEFDICIDVVGDDLMFTLHHPACPSGYNKSIRMNIESNKQDLKSWINANINNIDVEKFIEDSRKSFEDLTKN